MLILSHIPSLHRNENMFHSRWPPRAFGHASTLCHCSRDDRLAQWILLCRLRARVQEWFYWHPCGESCNSLAFPQYFGNWKEAQLSDGCLCSNVPRWKLHSPPVYPLAGAGKSLLTLNCYCLKTVNVCWREEVVFTPRAQLNKLMRELIITVFWGRG